MNLNLNLTHQQIISILGGVKAVSRLTGVSVQAVNKWKLQNSIPTDKLMMLASLIEKKSHGLVTRQDMFPKSFMWIWTDTLPKNNSFGVQEDSDGYP
jgi:DNA-binding transcriptional regulator YdaS (Cro superfamily)